MKKILILSFFLILAANLVSASYCYQESANVSNQSGTDGVCGLNYTGKYATPDNYLNINYSKPQNYLVSAIWQVKHGKYELATYNITLPTLCNDLNPIQLRIYSEATETNSTPQCYNGSTWINIGTSIFNTGAGGGYSAGDVKNMYDGDWGTDSAFWATNGWVTVGSGAFNASIWDEGMWWNIGNSCVGATQNAKCGDTINESCTLNGNIVAAGDCFDINTDNIVMDCNGYKITDTVGANIAIDVAAQHNNVSVKNCVFSSLTGNWNYDVKLSYGGHNWSVINNSFGVDGYTAADCLYLLGQTSSLFENNTFYNCSGVSVQFAGLNYSIFRNNKFFGTNTHQAYAFDGNVDHNLFYDDLITSSSDFGIGLASGAMNNSFYNTNVTVGIPVYAPSNTNNSFINITQLDWSSSFFTGGPIVNIKWWLYNFYVNNSAGAGINSVNVSLYNKNGLMTYSALSNSTGFIPTIEVLEYYKTTASNQIVLGNYTINASLSGYVTNSSSRNISSSTNGFATLANNGCVGATTTFVCNDTITESCTFNGNITNDYDIAAQGDFACFNVHTNNIIIDGNGYYLINNGSNNKAYAFNGTASNTTIKNVVFDHLDINKWYHLIYYIGGSSINVLNNTFLANATGNFPVYLNKHLAANVSNNNFNGDNNNHLYLLGTNNSYISNNKHIITPSNTGAIFLSSSFNNTFYSINISGSSGIGAAIQFGTFGAASAVNNTFYNSIITNAGDYDFYELFEGNNSFVNSTVNLSKSLFGDIGVTYKKWYLDSIFVNDSSNNPIVGATVNIYDKNGVLAATGTTNALGFIGQQVLSEYYQNGTGSYYFTNYNINVSKIGYVDNTTVLNLTNSTTSFVTLSLTPVIPVVVASAGASGPASQTGYQCLPNQKNFTRDNQTYCVDCVGDIVQLVNNTPVCYTCSAGFKPVNNGCVLVNGFTPVQKDDLLKKVPGGIIGLLLIGILIYLVAKYGDEK